MRLILEAKFGDKPLLALVCKKSAVNQLTFICSKSTVETLGKGVIHVQS